MADGFAQSVKQQADIVRVIGDYVRLTKAGAQSYKGLCPFHKEKSPSFNVHATQQFFHCFGCGQSGDVFTFVQKLENLTFPEAVRAVAQKCGIPLPKQEFSSPEEARESRLRKRLLDAHEQASRWFEEQLQSPEAARAREYLTSRGVTAETIANFHIGYAPESFSAMRDRMLPDFDNETLRASGLFSWKDQEGGQPGPMYARFRKRITFPIRNEAARVIAFTARALEVDEKAGPKYLNSPETPLYTKGNVLFNLDKAKQAIRQYEFALLVEGQMDCISVYMAGVPNVLATSGTAFTDAQVRLLTRYTKQVVLNFDPDTAGANAAEKSIAMLVEEGFSVKVVTLDGGLDPDRFVRERGVQEYIAVLRAARRHGDYLIDRARALFPPITPDAKAKAINYLLPHIQRIPSRIVRDEFAADAAQKLGIDSAVVRQELRQAAGARRTVLTTKSTKEAAMSEAEKLLLLVLTQPGNESARALACERLQADPTLHAGLATSNLIDTLRCSPQSANPLELVSDVASRHLLATLLMQGAQGGDREISSAMVEDALHALAHSRLERRQRSLRRELAEAEARGDAAQVQSLMAEKVALDRILREN
ncbi:MAG TPA: DNA primase [Acidobacteriaceae bacterium]|jgi:DNA primase|nr:DNA primase [Acidobacteriaceae bacterium]